MAHEYTNDLIHEKSPYLLQHAHNPVDWNAWNDETLRKARDENRPIFLSIGYSTCHWCHVMEHESFEDERIAAIMNRYFVNVKVDREERPDVDQVYMHAVQAMGQQGGWPLSVWLTPDLKPFYGGTYFPPSSRYGRPGFVEIMERIHALWTENEPSLRTQANSIATSLAGAMDAYKSESGLDAGALDNGFYAFRATFDAAHGGFGRAPKFPRPTALAFLLRYSHRTGNDDALSMVIQTLRHMALGGIHDHLAGGFARYSVDPFWRVPHFEKMLYDQAQLMSVYAQTYQITNLPDIAAAVLDIAGYVQRDMTDEAGGFYSAEDADSLDENGLSREGAYYAWTLEELDDILGADAARLIAAYYGMTAEGNYEHGLNVLHVSASVPDVAENLGLSEDEARATLQESLRKLAEVRSRRPRPHRDDKILTAWNGLMISGLAEAYQAMGNVAFLASADRAAAFILSTMWNPETRTLMRRYRDGDVAIEGFLDDHAFFATGLLDLYEASLEPAWLRAGVDIAQAMLDKFWDPQNGGFFFTATELAGMPRRKDDHDGAEPSGNSAAALLLLRLSEMTGDTAWREKAERTVRAFSGVLAQYPEMSPAMLGALDMMLAAPQQVVVAGDRDAPDTRTMLRLAQGLYLPNTTLMLASGGDTLHALAPWTADMSARDGAATAYVCRDFACQAPITDPAALAAALEARP